MVFNPYQSNLLRFVVGQYQRGVDRHRSAFGQAHTQVKLSAELGTGLVMLPVYMAARGAMLAGRRLRQSLSQQRFNTLNPQVKKLLNFSGFGVSGLGSSGFEAVDSPSTHLQPSSVSHGAMQGSAQPIFQTLVAVGACLSSAQIRALSAPGSLTSDGSGQSRLMRWVGRWRAAARQLVSFDREILRVGSQVELGFGQGNLSSPAQVTRVASDLKTRSLLLVLNYSTVWNGLSADQQLRLQHQIAALLSCGFIRLPFKAKDSIAVYKLAEPVSTSPFPAKLLCDEKSDRQRVRAAIEVDVVSVAYVELEHPLEKMLKWVDRILLWIEKQWQRIRAVLHK